MIDHLVLAVPDLTAAVDDVAHALGVRPGAGGSHPGWGTRNALLSLGTAYLEVIGPDPDQDEPDRERPFAIDGLGGWRLAAWAVRTPDIDGAAAAAREAGHDPGPVVAMRRVTPSGTALSWRLTMPRPDAPLVPFLIAWDDCPHPASTAPAGASLAAFAAEHPDPPSIRTAVAALGGSLEVRAGARARLLATIAGPAGALHLA